MNTIEENAYSHVDGIFSEIIDKYQSAPWNEFRDALAQIYLAGANEALHSQWKDASKELPEEDEYVLIDGPRGIEAAWWNSHYQCWDDAEGDDNMYDKDKVSHWLPIPDLLEPPKDESI